MIFTVGQRVMTATSNPFTENRRGVVAEALGDDLYVLDDRGLRLIMHSSELVEDDREYDYRVVEAFVNCAFAGRAQGFRRDGVIEALRRLAHG